MKKHVLSGESQWAFTQTVCARSNNGGRGSMHIYMGRRCWFNIWLSMAVGKWTSYNMFLNQ